MGITKMGGGESRGPVYVLESKSLPEAEHFAVLVDKSISYEQNWGRGSETCNERYVQYIAFKNQEELEVWIMNNHTRATFKVISSKPIKVTMKAVIAFNE